MKDYISKSLGESTILFLTILKWILLATVAGVMVGFSTGVFLKLLNKSTVFVNKWKYSFLFIPFAFFISSLIVTYLAPDAKGHGTEKIIESLHKRDGNISFWVVPVKLIATIITLASGGSAGKEGPCAQIGAGITSAFSRLLRFDSHDRKKMVICGIGAGFASVFGTPIAGAIFGVEVLFVGSILYEVLLPSFVAGITAYQVTSSMGIKYFYRPLNFVPVFSEVFMLKVIGAGIISAVAVLILIVFLRYFEKKADGIKTWKPNLGLIGGTAIIIMTLLTSKKYLGLGVDTIENSLLGVPANWYDFILKIIFTSITLSFGGSGGIVTPIFFIGATVGSFYARIMNLDYATFAAICMTAVLSGAANTPIAASIMSVELFGPSIAPYAAIACIISFIMTGHKSVYPSQVVSISKSAYIKIESGKEIRDIDSVYSSTPLGLSKDFFNYIRKIQKQIIKKLIGL